MIKLNVNHNKITNADPDKQDTPVVGNINSILVKFIFSAEWNRLARAAVFTNGESKRAVYLGADTCRVPWEVLTTPGELFVSLRGMGENGEYVICTENECLGKVLPSDACSPPADAEAATPNVIDALLAATVASTGKSAYTIAVENGFEGSEVDWLASLKGVDGRDGLPGINGADGHTPVRGTDYWTEADRQGIVNDVLASLPTWEGGSY